MKTPRWLVVPVVAAALVLCGSCGQVDHGAEDPPPITGCPDPQPIPQPGDVPSGFVVCSDGLVHRETAEACIEPYLPGDCDEDFGGAECAADSDCGEAAYGACVKRPNGCFCDYGCASDADCGSGVCVCAGSRARCVPADCSSSADCGGGLCVLDSGREVCGAPVMRLACHDDSAACRTEADCTGEETYGACPEGDPEHVCRFLSGEWTCAAPLHCGGPCG